MQTFTIVDGEAYRGTFSREIVQLANLQFATRSYLSAHGPFGWLSVSKMSDLDAEPVAESELRSVLAEAIKKKMT